MLMPGTMMAGRVLERNNGGLFFDVSLSAFVFAKLALLAMAAAAAAATGLKHAKSFIQLWAQIKVRVSALNLAQKGFQETAITRKK